MVPTVSSGARPAAAATQCDTYWGSLSKDSSASSFQPLVNIRTGEDPCYDRMVLDLPGTSALLPVGYHVHYVDALEQDPSGEPIPVAGGAILEIVVRAPSYGPNYTPTYPGRVGQPLPGVDITGYRTFVDTRFASTFEGDTQLGLGVRARLPFRVFQLDNRLVIDVAHSW